MDLPRAAAERIRRLRFHEAAGRGHDHGAADHATVGDVDVLVIGAGISGIGAAYRLQQNCPDHSYAILEARQAIGMLRDADDELPGPDRPSELSSDFTIDTGVPCRFTMSGEQRDLSPGVRLALYRVAQEALTNVRKHARNPEQAEVRLDYQPGTVTLTVEDTVRQPVHTGAQHTPQHETPVSGYGLTGMRERAGLLGGVLEAGPTDTGFRVRLRVPA